MDQWHAFGVTLACEVPVMLWLARRLASVQVALITLAINGLTHPAAWTAALLLSPTQYRLGLWVIEGIVVLTEAAWYRGWLGIGWRPPGTALRPVGECGLAGPGIALLVTATWAGGKQGTHRYAEEPCRPAQ